MKHTRYAVLDCIRGFALVNMIAYHAIWDLVYIFGVDWSWYRSAGADLRQQAICCTFILLSGFCQPLGRQSWKRGLTVFLAGAVITVATLVFMPENRIVFGVLTLLGSCMLLAAALKPLLQRCPAAVGFALCLIVFVLTRFLARGYLGIGSWQLPVPDGWYRNYLTAYLGLPMGGFWSTDYFPLIPWAFLFFTGYFLHGLCRTRLSVLQASTVKPLEWLGRHSLIVYMLHQPLVYGLLMLLF